MQQAINKYASMPKVRENSVESLDQIQKPLMYICQDDQFNYTKARQIGYESKTDYLSGLLSGIEKPTWVDQSRGFKTATELLEHLHDHDYNDLNIVQNKTNLNASKVFLLPYGYCMDIRNVKLNISSEFQSKKRSKFIILDPYSSTNIRAEQILGKSATMKHYEITGLYEFSWYKVTYTLYDDTIMDGDVCTDYGKITSSYGECVEKAVVDKLQEFYGCIPIWFPGNFTKCDTGSYKKNDKANEFVARLLANLDLQTNCKPPCMSLEMSLDLISETSNFPGNAVLNIIHHKEVTIHKLTLSYDAFSLIVELGK